MSTLLPNEYILYSNNIRKKYIRKGIVPSGITVPTNTMFSCDFNDGFITVEDAAKGKFLLINVRIVLPSNARDLIGLSYFLRVQQGSRAFKEELYDIGKFRVIEEGGQIVTYSYANIPISWDLNRRFFIRFGIDFTVGDDFVFPNGSEYTINYFIHTDSKLIPTI